MVRTKNPPQNKPRASSTPNPNSVQLMEFSNVSSTPSISSISFETLEYSDDSSLAGFYDSRFLKLKN